MRSAPVCRDCAPRPSGVLRVRTKPGQHPQPGRTIGGMSVSPLPSHGGIHFDRRDGSRALRVSAHAELGVVTVSLWRDSTCIGTHQLGMDEIPKFIEMLAQALVDAGTPAEVVAS